MLNLNSLAAKFAPKFSTSRTELEDPKDLTEWLEQGPFTLALSSSFFGFYAHCGIVTALYERGFVPSKFSGASAGALVAAGLASGQSPGDLQRLFYDLKQSDFWDPSFGLGYLKGDKFRSRLNSSIGRFFWETRWPLEVAVYDILSRQTKFISDGSIADAVSASCAVPLFFHPVRIENRFYYDGGIARKSGMRHENKDERILCVMLESRARFAGYETRGLTPNTDRHRIWLFRDLPKADFRRLETGRVAFDAAYERARRLLSVSN